jgi:hypothetical protein
MMNDIRRLTTSTHRISTDTSHQHMPTTMLHVLDMLNRQTGDYTHFEIFGTEEDASIMTPVSSPMKLDIRTSVEGVTLQYY